MSTKASSTRTRVKSKPVAPPSSGTPWIWVVGFVLIAAAATLAVVAMQGWSSDSDSDAAQTAAVEIAGDGLPLFSTPDRAIGSPAPSITAQDFGGGTAQVNAGDGVSRLYGFFAHWCPHCQEELPRTVEWLSQNELPEAVEIVAISTSVDQQADNYPPSAWFAEEGWPTTVLLDDENSTIAQNFGLTGFPFWVAVDGDGSVVSRSSGQLTTDQFESLVASLGVAAAG